MPERLITNANDVELIIEGGGVQRGTSDSMGRIVVDDFTVTREEDGDPVSGVGTQFPRGHTNGDVSFSFSFTILGEDVTVFETVANQKGASNFFSFTAYKEEEDGTLRWEIGLDGCKAATEELSASSGDPIEYAVDGSAISRESTGILEDGSTAWN